MRALCASVSYYNLVGGHVWASASEQTPRTFVGAGRSLFDRRELLRGRINVCPADRGEA
jgi:hypothetical protein